MNNGTGRNALVKNTRIIGKTGTTKRLTNQGYNEESFNASFIGMAELDDRDYVFGHLSYIAIIDGCIWGRDSPIV